MQDTHTIPPAQRPFGMLFALEAAPDEISRTKDGELQIETLDCGTSKISNTH